MKFGGVRHCLFLLSCLAAWSKTEVSACTCTGDCIGFTVIAGTTTATCDSQYACSNSLISGCDAVVCSGERACQGLTKIQMEGGNVICSGQFSCHFGNGATEILDANTVECSNFSACGSAIITALTVKCSGFLSCSVFTNVPMITATKSVSCENSDSCRGAIISSKCLTCGDGSCSDAGSDLSCTWQDVSILDSEPVNCRDELVTTDCSTDPPTGTPTGTPTTSPTTAPASSTTSKDGGAFGDPHYVTFGGKYYEYMGKCDMILLQVKNFINGLPLMLVTRTTTRYSYSYIESVVVSIGKETFQVSGFGQWFLNKIASGDLSIGLAGRPINYKRASDKVHSFAIDLGGGETIQIKTLNDMLSVKVHTSPTNSKFQQGLGMMGEFGTGRLLNRHGNRTIDDPIALAAEWQVRDEEPMLFQAVREPQYPASCILPDATTKSVRRLGEAKISQEMAEQACSTWPKDLQTACIHDTLATQDLDLALVGVF